MTFNGSKLLRTLAIAGLLVAFTHANAAAATLVSFSTTGTFASSGTNSVSLTSSPGNTSTFTYNGALAPTPGSEFGAPTNVSLGDLQLFITGTGYDDGAQAIGFTLTINQTVPSVGSGNLSGTLAGTIARISPNSSDFALTFTTPSVQIGDIVYTLDQLLYRVVPFSSGCGGGALCGTTTVQGTIAAVPEPTTMMLLGTGLLAAFRARRRNA